MSVTFFIFKRRGGFFAKITFFSLSKSKVRNYLHVSIILLSLTTIVQKCNLFYSIIERRVFLIFFVLKNQGKSFEKEKKWMTFFAILHGYFQSFWCCQIDCSFSLASISLGWWIFLRFFLLPSCQKVVIIERKWHDAKFWILHLVFLKSSPIHFTTNGWKKRKI